MNICGGEKTVRILIADDEIVSRRKLEFTLSKCGWDVIATADGLEALSVMESSGKPWLAVLDVMMPGLDGIEVCRRVRARTSEIPSYLILLTSKNAREDVLLGFEA